MRAGVLLLAAVAVVGLPATTRAQTRLEQIYTHMHGGPTFPAPVKPGPKPDASPYSLNNAVQGAEAGKALLMLGIGGAILATTPFWLPVALFDQNDMNFSKYPYAYPGMCLVAPGSGDPLDNAEGYWENERITKGWALRTSVDVGNNSDDLSRVGGQVFLDTNFNRLGLLANVNWYREHNPLGKDPSALMSDVNVTYRLTQCEWLQMHVGLGARAWRSLGDVSGGVNGFYRGDLFPCRPVTLSTIYEVGNLDQSLFMHFRTQVGVNWRHGELFLGFDWTRLAGVTLQGPLVGLRLWF